MQSGLPMDFFDVTGDAGDAPTTPWFWSETTAQDALLERCDARTEPMARCQGVGRSVTFHDGTVGYEVLLFSLVWDDPDGEDGIAGTSGRLWVESRESFRIEFGIAEGATVPPGFEAA